MCEQTDVDYLAKAHYLKGGKPRRDERSRVIGLTQRLTLSEIW